MAPPTVEVEISDLRGWAQQVGRGSKDMGTAHGYGSGHLTDADFGRILELITRDYDALIPKLLGILDADSTGLRTTSAALDASATSYKQMDERSRNHFTQLPGGGSAHTTDDGVANGFDDVQPAAAKLVAPDDGGEDLPEVKFGFPFDQVNDLIAQFTGIDIREALVAQVRGDVRKAARHASAWQHLGECTEAVDGNLDSGRAAIIRTWKGDASTASAGHMDKWGAALTEQSEAMRKVSKYLRDAIEQAVKVAQVIFDVIKTIISLVLAGWSGASIPLWGQWKLIKSIKEAATMIWSAYKVINVFKNALTMIVDGIRMCVDALTMEKLPPAPATALPK
jgi:uncharacterized protein YukE